MLENSFNTSNISNNSNQNFQSKIPPKNPLIIAEYPATKVSKDIPSKSETKNAHETSLINQQQNNEKESNILNKNPTIFQTIYISNTNTSQQNFKEENNNINISSSSNKGKNSSINQSQSQKDINNKNNNQNSQKNESKIPLIKSIQTSQKKNSINIFEINRNTSLMGKKIDKALPVYNLIKEGKGISRFEEQGIVFCAMTIYQEEIRPLSNNTAKYIKTKLGGDWLVIIYPEKKPIDYHMTSVSRNDFMFFTLDTTAYQVCRLR